MKRPALAGRAVAHFRRAIALDPQHADASSSYYQAGKWLHEAGRAAEAEELYAAAVDAGIWTSVLQRPGYLAAGVKYQAPWPTPALAFVHPPRRPWRMRRWAADWRR